jgi:hypothetical protein
VRASRDARRVHRRRPARERPQAKWWRTSAQLTQCDSGRPARRSRRLQMTQESDPSSGPSTVAIKIRSTKAPPHPQPAAATPGNGTLVASISLLVDPNHTRMAAIATSTITCVEPRGIRAHWYGSRSCHGRGVSARLRAANTCRRRNIMHIVTGQPRQQARGRRRFAGILIAAGLLVAACSGGTPPVTDAAPAGSGLKRSIRPRCRPWWTLRSRSFSSRAR